MTTTPRRNAACAAAALVLALVAGACSGDGEGGDTPEAPADRPSAAAPLVTTTSIGRVSGGRLPAARKQQVKTRVERVLDPWIDAAYVGGDWPRTGFADVFRGFTSGARLDARDDLDLMSNADIGSRVDSVTTTRRRLVLDVLAVGRRAVGVTARLALTFRTTGEVERVESVRGRLFLTSGKDGWRVFGYDLAAGDGRGDGKNVKKSKKNKSSKNDAKDGKGSTR